MKPNYFYSGPGGVIFYENGCDGGDVPSTETNNGGVVDSFIHWHNNSSLGVNQQALSVEFEVGIGWEKAYLDECT